MPTDWDDLGSSCVKMRHGASNYVLSFEADLGVNLGWTNNWESLYDKASGDVTLSLRSGSTILSVNLNLFI